ncbi:polysaccharide biosynthesis C-terminal domain-containing protein [Halonotius sp. GCM10025705]|uniref:lipid II flippase MurJ n=1 Tax=Halonotius sp. GCM10025705 TaxID=3252678 RepID=UPI00361ADAF9
MGAEPLGVYNVVIGLVSWLAIAGKVGLSKAISKRVSEGVEQGAYTSAGVIIIGAMFLVLAAGIILFRSQVVDYVGYPATGFIVLILLAVLLNGLVNALLMGLHLVHVSGVLSPIRTGGRAIAQIALVAAGASTIGLFLGYIVGFVVAIAIGAYYVLRNVPELSRPERRHFESLANFAKFSWLGSLQSSMFSYTDVLVLGVFVSSGLIGVYAVAWNIAQFLILFSGTLQSTLFPEMSSMSAEGNPQAVARIVEQSLSFGGLFLIPGLFGGTLLGERILRLYGPEFPKGATILTLLIVANLIMGYQTQFLNTLNAIDRPDLAFRVNIVFVGTNIALNVGLIYLYGWVGAAVATTTSVAISLVFAYRYVDAIIDFDVPTGEIGKQWFAAALMALLVYGGLYIENTYRFLGHNIAVLFVLITVGAGVYSLTLLSISTEFREIVDRNVPVALPLISR